MDNETTMPGLLTLPGTLDGRARPQGRRSRLYWIIFIAAVLALVLGIWLY